MAINKFPMKFKETGGEGTSKLIGEVLHKRIANELGRDGNDVNWEETGACTIHYDIAKGRHWGGLDITEKKEDNCSIYHFRAYAKTASAASLILRRLGNVEGLTMLSNDSQQNLKSKDYKQQEGRL